MTLSERECCYTSDFDLNGVLYYLGTRKLTQTWSNPAEIGVVKLSSSQIKHDSDSITVFVGRSPARGVLDDVQNAWFCVDLLENTLVPTFYTLRHYNSKATVSLRRRVMFCCYSIV